VSDQVRAGVGDAAHVGGGRSGVGGRLYAFAETLAFIGLLNLLMIVMTAAGGVILGLAPAWAAAAACVRAHLRGEGGSTTARFLRAWRSGLLRANLLQAPAALVAALLAVNLWTLGAGRPALAAVFTAALALTGAYQILVIAMDAHYELRVRECLAQAGRFLWHAPGVPLLLAATVALIGCLTWMIPGLLPVVSIGATAYCCTALCLSCFAANDRRLAA
jgi:uncharacterized membrane protein YesL